MTDEKEAPMTRGQTTAATTHRLKPAVADVAPIIGKAAQKSATDKRAEARQAAREKANEGAIAQAQKDALVKAPAPELLDVSKLKKRKPTLHELNMHSRVVSEEVRDTAMEAAQAAGKAALGVLTGKAGKRLGLNKRNRNLRPLQDSLKNAATAAAQ